MAETEIKRYVVSRDMLTTERNITEPQTKALDATAYREIDGRLNTVEDGLGDRYTKVQTNAITGDLTDLETPEKGNLVASINSAQEQLNDHTGVLGAKNLLPNNGITQTISGVTFTKNADGSVTANGTATAAILYIIVNGRDTSNKITISDGEYILSSGQPYNAATKFLFFSLMKNAAYVHQDIGTTKKEGAAKFTLSGEDYDAIHVGIFITNSTTVSNLTFYPMLRLASDPDPTYVPYAMTNRELTEKVTDITSRVSPFSIKNGMLYVKYTKED